MYAGRCVRTMAVSLRALPEELRVSLFAEVLPFPLHRFAYGQGPQQDPQRLSQHQSPPAPGQRRQACWCARMSPKPMLLTMDILLSCARSSSAPLLHRPGHRL